LRQALAVRQAEQAEQRQARRAAGLCEECGGKGLHDVEYCGCEDGRLLAIKAGLDTAAARAAEVNQRLDLGGVPPRYQFIHLGVELDDLYPVGVMASVRGWLAAIDEGEGRWLVLSGLPREGKTRLAAAIARRYAEENNGSIAWVRPDRLQQRLISTGYRDEAAVLDPLYNSALLVIDDLGEVGGPVERKLLMILKHRFEQCLPTLITTMLTLGDLEQRHGGSDHLDGAGQAVGESLSWRLAEATAGGFWLNFGAAVGS